MPPTRITVDHERMIASTSGSADKSGGKHTLVYKVAWKDLRAFVLQAAGSAVSFGKGTYFMKVPWECPEWPGFFAESLSWRGVALPPNRVVGKEEYSWAEVSVTFGSSAIPYNDETWKTVRLSGSMQVVTVPGNPFRFADGLSSRQDCGNLVPVLEVHVSRSHVPALEALAAAVLARMGRVNSDPMTSLVPGVTCDPGTVLFPAPETDITNQTTGKIDFSVSLKFLVRGQSWQYAVRPDNGVWAPVFRPDGSPPYPTAVLSDLLTV